MNNKKTIVLDLDETVIFTTQEKEDNVSYDLEFTIDTNFKEEFFYTTYRPHLKKFIKYIEANFNIIVWTSSTSDYAKIIVDNIFNKKDIIVLAREFYPYQKRITPALVEDLEYAPTFVHNIIKAQRYWNDLKKIDLRFISSEISLYTKPLKKLIKNYPQYNIKDIICIDNDPYKFYQNFGNYWFIKDFKGNKDDDYLLKFINLLEKIKDYSDVREIKKESFKPLILE